MKSINLYIFISFHFHRPPDLYHTCYTLSGVSVAQHSEIEADPFVIGDILNNELLPTHPLYNTPPKCVWQAFMHFQNYDDAGECSSNGDKTNQDYDNDDLNGHQ